MSTKTVEKLALPVNSMGTERTLTVIHYGDGSKPIKAYIQAGLHADEAPGYLVMHHLIKLLDAADQSGAIQANIVLVPVANPVGADQWHEEVLRGRFDFFNYTNFNRKHLDIIQMVAEHIKDQLTDSADENKQLIRQAMATALQAVSSEDESAQLKHMLLSLAVDADIVLDLHCDYQAITHVYMGTPLWPDARDLSAQIGAQATLLAKVSGGNPFDEACSRIWWELAEKYADKPIPCACLAATVELRGIADVSHELAVQDAQNIYYFLQRRGFITGEAPIVPDLLNEATPLRGVEHIKATTPGIAVFLKTPGDMVKPGDVIVEVIDPLATSEKDAVTPIKTNIEGIVISINVDRFARPGRILSKVAGKKPLAGKGKTLLTA